MIGNFPEVLNFNRSFLKLNRFICNQPPVLPGHSCAHTLENLDFIQPQYVSTCDLIAVCTSY